MKKTLMVTLIAFFTLNSTVLANEIGEAISTEKENSKIDEVSTNPPVYEEAEAENAIIKHEVQFGDTMWKIAGYYHVDFKELLELNSQLENPNLIYPQEKIKIPNAQVKGVYFSY